MRRCTRTPTQAINPEDLIGIDFSKHRGNKEKPQEIIPSDVVAISGSKSDPKTVSLDNVSDQTILLEIVQKPEEIIPSDIVAISDSKSEPKITLEGNASDERILLEIKENTTRYLLQYISIKLARSQSDSLKLVDKLMELIDVAKTECEEKDNEVKSIIQTDEVPRIRKRITFSEIVEVRLIPIVKAEDDDEESTSGNDKNEVDEAYLTPCTSYFVNMHDGNEVDSNQNRVDRINISDAKEVDLKQDTTDTVDMHDANEVDSNQNRVDRVNVSDANKVETKQNTTDTIDLHAANEYFINQNRVDQLLSHYKFVETDVSKPCVKALLNVFESNISNDQVKNIKIDNHQSNVISERTFSFQNMRGLFEMKS